MKKVILGLVLVVTASGASAECFNFINGKGPNKVGNYALEATATSTCVTRDNRGDMKVVFSDSQGDLAIIGGEQSGSTSIALNSGNVGGSNVNFSGLEITFETKMSNLGLSTGTMKIRSTRQLGADTYLIMEKRR